MSKGRMKRTRADVVFDTCNIVFMCLMLFVFAYPLYFTVVASLSDPYAVVRGRVFFWPVNFTVEPYTNVFQNGQIWIGYRNSAFYTVGGTILSLITTIPAAYALSKKNLPLRTLATWFFIFTMYFHGGLIPTYLIVRDLKLLDTPYVLMILGCFSVYNTVVTRTYFSNSIPDELYEAGRIDGAGELRMFFTIAIPLAGPIIAVMALYYSVGFWNSYYNALIYISRKTLEPLQLVLRKILILNETAMAGATTVNNQQDAEYMEEMARRQYMAQGMKYSVVFIASAPMLVAYPFVQKYFVKGVMIGSLKG